MAMLDLDASINLPYAICTVEYTRETPIYRRLLRPLGAYFDSMHACELTLAEFEFGFFWSFFADNDYMRAVHGEMPYDEILACDEAYKRNRTAEVASSGQAERKGVTGILGAFKPRTADHPSKRYSSGYEDLLRSLAVKFDFDRVSSVLLIERAESWLVRTCLPVPLYVQANQQRRTDQNYFHDSIYRRPEIMDLITTVRDYRGMI